MTNINPCLSSNCVSHNILFFAPDNSNSPKTTYPPCRTLSCQINGSTCLPTSLNQYQTQKLIQNTVPHLSVSEREFLMSGITDDEWDAEFSYEAE